MLWLLIDAHNVIHADPDLRRMLTPDPERARLELERLLSGRQRTTVFHDGGPLGEARVLRRRGLSVVYCGAEEADDAIIRWLKQHPSEHTAVVSDDADVGRRARQLKAQVLATRPFLASLRQRTDAPVDAAPLPAHEVDLWLREFGFNSDGTPRSR
jgi:hypothetical protein